MMEYKSCDITYNILYLGQFHCIIEETCRIIYLSLELSVSTFKQIKCNCFSLFVITKIFGVKDKNFQICYPIHLILKQ